MTPTLEDHERRLTVVEERLDQEAGLRASQDRDLAAIAEGVRVQGRLIQALAVTQSEHTRSLAQLTDSVNEVNGKIDEVNGKIDGVNGKIDEANRTIDEVQGGITQIIGMVETLIERRESR
ncbi:hypothetical protein ODJ79_33980 [Actinoplanes sp. KI2]|uniref:hypothetical protein n=1 Tax=Actinoplanes sp. KI2 TaxID=2983315 RepID=UPI0021D5FF65|nr:hypothetical protein [Actinoplanes sp. KI2]MCU7728748.1 hypothetical protein [Actinoplanes sp. KI2]